MEETKSAADGRVLRSERSRKIIVEASLALYEKGVLVPTAQQVAEQAGVGIRTVFRHFNDMDALYAEVYARVHEGLRDIIESSLPEGTLEDRCRTVFERRCELFERMAAFPGKKMILLYRSGLSIEGAHTELLDQIAATALLLQHLDEVALAVELADDPRRLGADAVDRADEVELSSLEFLDQRAEAGAVIVVRRRHPARGRQQFGLGVDRVAMLRYGVDDIRHLLQALDVLADLLRHQQAAHERFADCFAAFDSPDNRARYTHLFKSRGGNQG